MADPRLDQLSERQKQCLRLLFANLSIKEIGAELDLAPVTVKGHLSNARRLLGVNRSMQAARILVRHEHHTLGIEPPRPVGLERHLPDEEAAAALAGQALVVRNRYHLGLLQRTVLIVAIAFVAVALAGALLIGAEALSRIFWDYRIDISDYPYRQ
jgi:DNA-binding CsgD family transcriptional regulator